MAQGIVWGLAAVLWPLLALFLWWSCHLPGRERTRSLLVLLSGAVAGMALVVLFGAPTLLRGEDTVSLSLFVSGKRLWLEHAVAAPLGALIARLWSGTVQGRGR
jgi:hypothetical protein